MVEGIARSTWPGASSWSRPNAAELALAGAGSAHSLWRTILAATTDRPLERRALPDVHPVGARLVVAAAAGEALDVDALNPVVEREAPDPDLVEAYRPVRSASDEAAAAVLGLHRERGEP